MISFDDVGGTIKSKSKYIISWRNLSEYEKYAFKEYHQLFKEEPDSLDLESWIKQRGFDGVCDWLDDSYFKMTETLRELVYEDRI